MYSEARASSGRKYSSASPKRVGENNLELLEVLSYIHDIKPDQKSREVAVFFRACFLSVVLAIASLAEGQPALAITNRIPATDETPARNIRQSKASGDVVCSATAMPTSASIKMVLLKRCVVLAVFLFIVLGIFFAVVDPELNPKARHQQWLYWSWPAGVIVYISVYCGSILTVPAPQKGCEPVDLSLMTALFAGLSIAPPVYFFFEAIWLYGKEAGKDEAYRFFQELASRIWVTLTLILGFYWFHDLK